MIPTYLDKLPETASSKHNRIAFWASAKARGGILIISTDRITVSYAVAEFAADGGRGFHFAKRTAGGARGEPAYSVFLPACSAEYPQCECRGFSSHARCKHLLAAAALVESGWL